MLKDLNDEQKLNMAFIGNRFKGLAHNINTPLSAILGRAEIMQIRLGKLKELNRIDTDQVIFDKCLKDISLVIENTNRVSGLIQNAMRKCVQAESSEMSMINLPRILKEEIEFLQADMFFKHEIQRTFFAEDTIPPLQGVYVHFSNGFLEILENSKQALLETDIKNLDISLKSDTTSIEVTFRDSGCGIEPEQKEKMLHILKNPPETIDTGIERIAALFKPYNAQFDIESVPGDTVFKVIFPL
jgi:signal transduction histidine kinase